MTQRLSMKSHPFLRNLFLISAPLFLSFLFSPLGGLNLVHAEEAVPPELSEVLDHYRQAESIILEVRKIQKNVMLDKEVTHKGMIRFVKGKFYWETSEPEKNLVVYDRKTLWTIQYPPSEFKEMPLQVAKMNIKNKKNSPILLAEIFGDRPIQSIFKVKQKSKDGALINYELKEKKSEFGLKNLILKIDSKEKRVASLEYVDEVENETKLEFRSTQFNIKIKQSLFNYKPPKNAKVTEY